MTHCSSITGSYIRVTSGDFPDGDAERGASIANWYSVFLLLWRVTYKLSSEAGNGEVTNPK